MNQVLENAIIRLLKRRPFYGHLLLNCRRSDGGRSHPLGVTIRDGVPLLLVGEVFDSYPLAAQEALLEHGVKHLLHLHMSRRKERNGHDWDIACDLAINPTIAGLPPDAPMPEDYGAQDGLAAEEYYRELTNPLAIGNQEGRGTGDTHRDATGTAGEGDDKERHRGEPLDDHTVWADADSLPVRLAEEVVREMVRDSLQRAGGDVPDDVREAVSALLKPPAVPWRQVLRQFVATAGRVGKESTWMRQHRRFDTLVPGTRKRHRLNLLVGIDVSDSTNIHELREAFAAELMGIARGRDAALTVLYANSRIRRIDSFRGEMVRAESYHGGGFTDLRPVFDYARTMHPLPAAVIYLTDGFGPAPEKMEFPTLWVLTASGEKPVPWGVELRLDV